MGRPIKRATPAPDADGALPSRLRCVVQDWVTPAELAELASRHKGNPDARDGDWQFAAERLAHRRHAQHRRDWLTARGIPNRDWGGLWPTGAPQWAPIPGDAEARSTTQDVRMRPDVTPSMRR